jgi:cytochrome c biogenesis protein CcmG/thiol:disulfide interchange protein DsbE
MVKPLMLVPLLVFGAFAALALVGLSRENPNELPSALAGRAAPAVQVTPLGEGPLLTDADLRGGGVKLLNYWASWCAPCRVEHPNLEKLAAQGITVYGVNYKDKPANALGFLAELGNPYAALGADESGRMALDWGVYGVPETYIIDAQGNIVMRFAGPITERVMENTILPAIEAAKEGG